MKEEIRLFLKEQSEEEYGKFSKKLISRDVRMLGVRLPVLRKKAKELAKEDWKKHLAYEDLYFEEVMLRGMMLSYVKSVPEEMFPYIKEFIKKVDNWSVCDSVFMKMDIFRVDREMTWEFIAPYLQSEQEFEQRVAIIIMMQHLLKCDENGKTISRLRKVSVKQCADKQNEICGKFVPRIFEALNHSYEPYYASMAAAWTIAEAFCCFPAHTMEFLKDNRLDDVTYNRSLQKIAESLIPEPEVKETIKKMKRRGTV